MKVYSIHICGNVFLSWLWWDSDYMFTFVWYVNTWMYAQANFAHQFLEFSTCLFLLG